MSDSHVDLYEVGLVQTPFRAALYYLTHPGRLWHLVRHRKHIRQNRRLIQLASDSLAKEIDDQIIRELFPQDVAANAKD